ncbi:MAG TPA: biotin/lipoyl-containing protein [Ktedonobacteraceae bacterium]|nr:biotin/lipoyl-containing protein [Ktedonobacteraceae bacterium]
MAYISSVAEKSYTIDIGENSPQREIRIDEKRFDIDWRQISALAMNPQLQSSIGGQYSLLIAGKSYEVLAHRVTKPDVTGYRYEVLVAGQSFEITVEDEREKALTGSIHGSHESSEAMVRAPMPGLVLRLPMDTGSIVERGQTVVVLEAMKMENDLASPISGKVKEIRVSKGQTVNQGDVLVVVSAN